MKPKILLVLGILAILAVLSISGCTNMPNLNCTPDWVFSRNIGGGGTNTGHSLETLNASCKGACKLDFDTTKIKLERVEITPYYAGADCYCDVNNCPQ